MRRREVWEVEEVYGRRKRGMGSGGGVWEEKKECGKRGRKVGMWEEEDKCGRTKNTGRGHKAEKLGKVKTQKKKKEESKNEKE